MVTGGSGHAILWFLGVSGHCHSVVGGSCGALPSCSYRGLGGCAFLWVPGALEHCVCGYRGLGPCHPVVSGGARPLPFCGCRELWATAIPWLPGARE